MYVNVCIVYINMLFFVFEGS